MALVVNPTPNDWNVKGFVAPGFESVERAFKTNLQNGDEVGASVTAYYKGKKVVDLTGGYFDTSYNKPYDNKTLQVVFSSGKCIEAVLVARLVQDGLFSYDDKITKYWPEFGANGKQNVTIKDLMGHRAGVSYLDGKERRPNAEQWSNLDVLAKMIADQPHNFDGKSVQSYHSFTRGWFLNEIVRRADPQHRTLGKFAELLLVKPLGIEFFYGIPAEINARVSPLIHYPYGRKDLAPLPPVTQPHTNPTVALKVNSSVRGPYQQVINTYEGRRGEGTSFSGITNSNGLAKIAALMANGGELDGYSYLTKQALDEASQLQELQTDLCLEKKNYYTFAGWGNWPHARLPHQWGEGANYDPNWEWW
ncbi:hypothetical protein SmJEL517_g04174 [Synchytrium microbalum]|uniref:Beta-lactamase-related domain-containing protein n=1 Tax=Synchytrium microbalum TaxID=1806994 RepID=A0A507C158_9FUNG|nr:uncharacterized protein SmJEL517_g04174 [Synchytrium microbalum]TPX32789.1 hypothetical protein SmJEL517_g04174 [Synchytrium microbalum]